MNMRLALGFCVTALLAVGCSTDSQRYCERRDECNTFIFGQNVDDCVRAMDRAFEDASPSEADDTQRVLADCLALESCDTFNGCVVGGRNDLAY